MTLVLRYAARSDRGLVRANNEDSVYAGARLLALADGMGGHAAGEVASQLVIAALAHLDDDEPGGDLLSKLDGAVRDGNSAIAAHVEADPELEGMGTTLTAILFDGNRLGLVHIGDSRGYMLRDGELAQITKDDTFVQTLVDEGRITAEEAHSHPQRSLIMRALTGHEVEPTLIMREARAGDRYLLCSDGLSDPVSHDTILDALQIPDVAESADRLIELALRGGGPDNVTVVVADVIDYDYGQTQPILAGAVSGDDDQAAPPDTAAGRASAFNPRRTEAKRVVAQPEEIPRRPRSRRKMLIAAAVLVLVVLAGLAVGREIVRNNYYVTQHDGTVSIMRGVQGSFLGYQLQEPYLLGCLNERNDLSLISAGQSRDNLDCRMLNVNDMRPSERAQIIAGLPSGSLDNAIGQIEELARSSVLPTCPTRTPPPPTPTATPPPPAPGPSESPSPAPETPTDPNSPAPSPTRGPLPGPAPETPTTVTAPPVADSHRAAAAALRAGQDLPDRVMTTQPQPAVTVLPPLPNRRNAELFLLGFATVITTVALLIVEANQEQGLSWDLATYTLAFVALFGGAHLTIRRFAPYADPLLLPVVALLNGLGLVMIHRLDLAAGDVTAGGLRGPSANQQMLWTLVGVIAFSLVVVFLRDHRMLARYGYVCGAVGLVLLAIPAVLPRSVSEQNGAKIWIRVARLLDSARRVLQDPAADLLRRGVGGQAQRVHQRR